MNELTVGTSATVRAYIIPGVSMRCCNTHTCRKKNDKIRCIEGENRRKCAILEKPEEHVQTLREHGWARGSCSRGRPQVQVFLFMNRCRTVRCQMSFWSQWGYGQSQRQFYTASPHHTYAPRICHSAITPQCPYVELTRFTLL